ncbi:AfsR/SARP family transcriptional regulator [Embleya scabrispora]|uniref:AfsR/SARP family transcriptional regulator n=1 Tax=Embleya scabrispora TaxID=159449 RepID=UPI00037EF6AD|nr:AfsR/SARP family transcriptional regulator [Embleya scabrispora]MYS84530.1 AAA family ATPase [Streptomyces sp. SID5474]
MLTFRVLGALEAWDGERPADLRGPRHRAVLARLVLARGHVVPVDRLIEDLWHGESPHRALGSVQTFVSHLRRALEPDRAPRTPSTVLVTAPPGYAFRVGTDEVDAWRFEALVHRAGGLLAAGAAEEALRELTAALDLWRGPAYAQFADEPWARPEAARLEELRLVAVERRAEAGLAIGQASGIVPGLEAHAAAHPLREESWRLLALAMYRCARQGDALAVLRRVRTALREELGVEPGARLQRLEADILAHAAELDAPTAVSSAAGAAAPALREAPGAAAQAPPSISAEHMSDHTSDHLSEQGSEQISGDATGGGFVARMTTLIGRAEETATLLGAAKRADGRLAVALVSGDPGEGKTALTEHVRELLAAEGWRAAWGRCPESGGAPAGWPWTQMLRTLAAVSPPDEETARVLAPLLADSFVPVGDQAAAKLRLHQAVVGYLARATAETPWLLVLDDVHRADEETLALLCHLATDRDAAGRVLLVVTYRHNEVGDLLADALARLARCGPERIELTGLAPEAVADLVRGAVSAPIDEDTVRAIVDRTAGNPFYVLETARVLAAEGAHAAVSEVPVGVRDVIRRHVAGLPKAAQEVLKQACVLGRDIDVDVLLAQGGTDEDTVLDAVESALLTGLLVEPDAGQLRFTHALVRDTLYEDLSQLRRARMHARTAEAIEAVRPRDVAALAHHYLASASRATAAKATHFARLAALDAEIHFAYREAAELWRGALVAFERSGVADEAARKEMEAGVERSLAQSGDHSHD